MARDRRQQVVEIMRDAAGQLANRLHLLALDELRLQRLQLGRVVEHRHQAGPAVLDRAAQTDLEIAIGVGPGGAEHFGMALAAAGQDLGQPVAHRTAEPFDDVAEGDLLVLRQPQQVASQPVGDQKAAVGADPRQRDRQALDLGRTVGRIGAGVDLGRRQQIDLAPLAGALDLGHDGAQRAVGARDLRLLARMERQMREDAVERLGPAAEDAAQRLVHEQDGARFRRDQHRQAERLGTAAGAGALQHLFKPPQEPPRADSVDREPQVAVARHHVLARRPHRRRLRLQPVEHRRRIGEEVAHRPDQALPAAAAEAGLRRAVLKHHLPVGVGAEGRRGIERDQVHHLRTNPRHGALVQRRDQPDQRGQHDQRRPRRQKRQLRDLLDRQRRGRQAPQRQNRQQPGPRRQRQRGAGQGMQGRSGMRHRANLHRGDSRHPAFGAKNVNPALITPEFVPRSHLEGDLGPPLYHRQERRKRAR